MKYADSNHLDRNTPERYEDHSTLYVLDYILISPDTAFVCDIGRSAYRLEDTAGEMDGVCRASSRYGYTQHIFSSLDVSVVSKAKIEQRLPNT